MGMDGNGWERERERERNKAYVRECCFLALLLRGNIKLYFPQEATNLKIIFVYTDEGF